MYGSFGDVAVFAIIGMVLTAFTLLRFLCFDLPWLIHWFQVHVAIH
ncbi:MAG: hypothetical protein K2Y22_04340 [Candidatus Obscuribacterales bacterium]|nr:hypothetical protein [Candidatus Obscuribacterales bacterium]